MQIIQYLPNPTVQELDIQGDVLIGLQKKGEIFAFFEITDLAQFRTDLAAYLSNVTNLQVTRLYELAIEQSGDPGNLPLDKMNIAFTYKGLKILGAFSDIDDTDPKIDHSFKLGQKSVAHTLGDDLANWRASYSHDHRLHGVALFASWRADPDDAIVAAKADAIQFVNAFAKSANIFHEEPGKVRSGIGANGVNQNGHEHFGFADGVSQPGVDGLGATNNSPRTDQGLPGQDLVAPGEFVFGDSYEMEVPPSVTTKVFATPPRDWMANGSYMVFRRLNQDVTAFRKFTNEHFEGLAADPDQFAARIIGRWPDGSPLAIDPDESNFADDGDHILTNNNFEFGPLDQSPSPLHPDPDQSKCPFAGHIRRMYMRSDAKDDASERRRILRAGIAFGNDYDADKGLLFVCYQTSIVNQFEFIQKLASNPTAFTAPEGLPLAAGMTPPPHDRPGVDLVLATPSGPRDAHWKTGKTPSAPPFVTATGGGYFFTPSISALSKIAAGTL